MGIFRDRMEQDLRLAQYRPSTQSEYLRCARRFVAFHMRPPDQLGEAEIREFLLTLVDRPASQKAHMAAIKFLYCRTLNRPEEIARIPWPKVRQKLPDILSHEEALRLLEAIANVKHRMILMAAYGSGLRITEACSLSVEDIDKSRGLIHVRRCKGGHERYVNLPDRLYLCLREYWKAVRPGGSLLFTCGQGPNVHVKPDAVRASVRRTVKKLNLGKSATPHSLRHAFATELLEQGTDIRIIQAVLGHRSIRTTARYTRVSKTMIGAIPSPLDQAPTEALKKPKRVASKSAAVTRRKAKRKPAKKASKSSVRRTRRKTTRKVTKRRQA